jgi:signal transduction histidine kinase/DNA-binding response OmpR family regulator
MPHRQKVLLLAPLGRDAAVASGMLERIGVASEAYPDLASLQRAVDHNSLFIIITEEALRAGSLQPLAGKLAAQPSWSDLPVIVLTQHGGGAERNPGAVRLVETLGNVTFVERPFHPTTFLSISRSALKARQRQFEARARMVELHESAENLRMALLAGRLGSWDLDLPSVIFTASAPCTAIFGRSRLAWDDLLDCIVPEDRDSVAAALRHPAPQAENLYIAFCIAWPDRSLRWVELRARVIRDEGGRAVRLVGVATDVTDRRIAEHRLRRLNEELEKRVVARTRELKQAHASVLAEIEQREQAQKQLRQAQKNEMIGQLTGGVAHDFNNLLMAVLGNLELLRKHAPDDARTQRLLDGAFQGARRGAALTQRLLAFARRQDLHLQSSSLLDLIRGMRDLIARSVGPGIDVRLDLPATLPPALVDGNQIELALLNLVINSRDAMPDGGTITIAADEPPDAAAGLASGRYVRLIVSDTGTGMDEQTLARATEPFFSTKELGKGTGLGLSMIQGLATQLNGTLRLLSTVGKGTRAELWLPASAADEQRPALPAPSMQDGAGVGRLTILVVDDDTLIASSTHHMLEDLGHEVIEAYSGDEALTVVRQNPEIDFVLTDFAMPLMNGVELARRVRSIRPDLPILLATGYAELPRDAFNDLPRLGKPYQQSELSREIAKAVRAPLA